MCDLAVIGLGIAGTSTLYQAAQRGFRVIGLERFPSVAHTNGSSHGKTRIIRQAYFEHPDYVPFVQEAYREWHRLEDLTNRTLLVRSGAS